MEAGKLCEELFLLHQVSDQWCQIVMWCEINQRLPTATPWKLPISQLLKEDKGALEGDEILSFEPMGMLPPFFFFLFVFSGREVKWS